MIQVMSFTYVLVKLQQLVTLLFASLSISANKKALKVAINDALPLKATRHDAIAKLNLFVVSNLSCRQTQCRSI